jgi:hypothetical protein
MVQIITGGRILLSFDGEILVYAFDVSSSRGCRASRAGRGFRVIKSSRLVTETDTFVGHYFSFDLSSGQKTLEQCARNK